MMYSSSFVLTHSSPSSHMVFSDPFALTPNDVVQQPNSNMFPPLDPFSPSFFSFSPPLENLSLYHPNSVPVLSNSPNLELSEIGNFSCLVKSEESLMAMGVEVDYNCNYNGASNLMQLERSYSSRSYTPMDASNFHSAEDTFFTAQMRRVCSTGDLQKLEANFKVGRYSAEERKHKISKYRAKRSQRNFNKTIKYACRKTLADNRPRIRGRFARNHDSSDNPNPSSQHQQESWFEGLHGEQEDMRGSAQEYVRGYGGGGRPQFQYYGFRL